MSGFHVSASCCGQRERYRRYYEEGRLCDVTLQAVARDGTSRDFNVHRVVMAGAGDVWEALLAGRGFLEAGQMAICIHETDADTLGLLIRSVYGLAGHVGPEDCVHMVNAADKFGMEDLRTALSARFVERQPTFADNRHLFLRVVMGMVQMEVAKSESESDAESNPLAKVPKTSTEETDTSLLTPLYCVDETIRNYCWAQVLAGFQILLDEDELLGQMSEEVLYWLLCSDDLDMPEIEIFRGMAKWAKLTGKRVCKGRPNSSNVSMELEDCVRYPLMSRAEFLEVDDSDLVCDWVVRQAYRARAEGHLDGEEILKTWPRHWLRPRMSQRVELSMPAFSDDMVARKNPICTSEVFSFGGYDWDFECRYELWKEGEPVEEKLQLCLYLHWRGPCDGSQEPAPAGVIASLGVRCKSLPDGPEFSMTAHYSDLKGKGYGNIWGRDLSNLDRDAMPPALAAGCTLTLEYGLFVRPYGSL